MSSKKIIDVLIDKNPKIKEEIERANYLLKINKFHKAAEKYRWIGNALLKEKLFSFALEYFSRASSYFFKIEKYEQGINCLDDIAKIYELNANYNGIATTYEKIASKYKYFFKNDLKAGKYYKLSAKFHEENQNIPAAFKKSKFAYEAFLRAGRKSLFFDSIGHATRLASHAG